jgi:hypothetical protein
LRTDANAPAIVGATQPDPEACDPCSGMLKAQGAAKGKFSLRFMP